MKYILIIAISFFSHCCLAQQIEKTLYKSVEPETAQTLVLKLNTTNIDVEKWEGSSIMIETIVKVNNASPVVIDYLQKQGRYKLQTKLNGGQIQITNSQINSPIICKGEKCEEKISYKVFVPNYMQVSKN